ncbi:MAG TPA: fumarylacetoacetase [Blastocatellia bacterium]|nr:fumarylacetoacetase [Blastocatellia bacterium]
MSYSINETHDPNLKSWIESANEPGCDFPIQNLPLGVFRHKVNSAIHVGVAIGDHILSLQESHQAGLLSHLPVPLFGSYRGSSPDSLMEPGPELWSLLRKRISELLRSDNAELRDNKKLIGRTLIPGTEAAMLLPARIGNYTDFYASVFHATNVGKMMRPDNPLLPNYKYVPIAYHGRASSVVVSGTPVRRPNGQTKAPDADKPAFGPSRLLDYEVEVGFFVGPGNKLGEPVSIAEAEDHIFGLCIVNDWSARDLQTWEYQPLGPFLAKSFATTISPWVVTMEALAPYRIPAFKRPEGDPEPLPHLDSPANREGGGIDLKLELFLSSQRMREHGIAPVKLTHHSFGDVYWTVAQMLAHHTSNGCNLRPGDLIASGTVSGPEKDQRGCLLELTWRGTEPIELPGGETRRFLEDGDEVIIRGFCEREGFARIGFGECRGIVLPAKNSA